MANVNFFSPDGGTTRYPIEDTEARSRIAGQQSLLKDTVGWTGKNLLKTVSLQNATSATAVLNEDGSVTINGTVTTAASVIGNFFFDLPAGDYILSGCVGGASGTYLLDVYENQWTNRVICYDGDTHFTFTTDTNHVARIYLYPGTYNNLTFYPMIRHVDITDPAYEPYHESVEEEIKQIRAGNGVLGAKNLLPYTRDSSTYTQSGVTYTRNADGSINANGTATANSFLPIAERLEHPINNLKKGVEYILSGDYGMGSGNGYVYANFYNGSTRLGGVNTGGNGSVKFKIPESINGTVVDDIDFGIGVLNGKTVNNFTFYPMLRLASDPDDTYQPYAMTNRELTKKAGVWTSPVSCLVDDTSATITNAAIHTTSTINPYIQTASGAVVAYSNLTVTEGQAVITFGAALTEAASVKLQILNI